MTVRVVVFTDKLFVFGIQHFVVF